MNLFISYSKWTSVTGRKLKASLGIKRAKSLAGFMRHNRRVDNVIINWGGSVGDGLTARFMANANAKMISHPDSIAKNKDKFSAIKRMIAQGVPAVESWGIDEVPADAYPVVARTKNHFGGSGFWRCNNAEELSIAKNSGANHATKLIIKSAEYRVHVFLDSAVRVVRKVKSREDADDLCRCHKNGWKFKKVADGNVPANLREIAIASVKALKLDIGAVDIVVQKRTNKLIVLEVNTSPGLEGSSLKEWTEAIKAKILGGN